MQIEPRRCCLHHFESDAFSATMLVHSPASFRYILHPQIDAATKMREPSFRDQFSRRQIFHDEKPVPEMHPMPNES